MYDIVFISYNEPNAEKNWESLKQRFPSAKRVDGVKGIHEAHKKAAKKMFYKNVLGSRCRRRPRREIFV